MNLRSANEADFPAILQLNQASVHFLSPMDRPRLQQLHAESALHIVVEQDAEVSAFLLAFRENACYDSPNYLWFQQRYPRFLYVDRIVVGESLRGLGVGKLLYQHVFSTADELGLPRVCCEFDLDPPNPVSAAFHAAFGFREVGRQSVSEGKKQVSLQTADLPSGNPQPTQTQG